MKFREFLKELHAEVIDGVVEDLRIIAEWAYEEAMRRKAFANHTGALSSSIGWAIAKDGQLLHVGGFIASGLGGGEGRVAGLSLARDMARDSKGIQLILLAGMDYATNVETKGFDVTTSGELLMEELVEWWSTTTERKNA